MTRTLHQCIPIDLRGWLVVQWLRDDAEKLKKQDAQLKASNDIFDRERQHLSTTNEILTKTVGGLQQQVAGIQANIQSVKQEVRVAWGLHDLQYHNDITKEQSSTGRSPTIRGSQLTWAKM